MVEEHTLPFEDDPAEVGRARSRVRGWVAAHPRCDDVVLAVSELVTNAQMHGGGNGELTVRLAGGAALVSVRDPGGGGKFPQVLFPGDQDLGGRGLQIVERLGDDWGRRVPPGGGTEVWVRFLSCPLADED